jgi:hypothetical protein
LPRRRKRLVSSWSRKMMPVVGVPVTPASAVKDAGKPAAKAPAAAPPSPVKRSGARLPLFFLPPPPPGSHAALRHAPPPLAVNPPPAASSVKPAPAPEASPAKSAPVEPLNAKTILVTQACPPQVSPPARQASPRRVPGARACAGG